MPEKSGLPVGVLGVGAVRFGFPSAVRGMSGVRQSSHWAFSETGSSNITTAIASFCMTAYSSSTNTQVEREAQLRIHIFLQPFPSPPSLNTTYTGSIED